jgi:hypothetical protein
MKIARYIALFLTLGFITIVSIERIPGVLTLTAVPYEWLMFGVFKISLVDDITHGLSALFGILALISGGRWTVKYLMVIGGYYSLDALFYVVNGFFTGMTLADNLILNAPHILISILVIIALRGSVKQIVLKSA